MYPIARTACASLFVAAFAMGGAIPALADSHMKDARGSSDMKVGHVDAKKSVDSLMEAVKELREASVLLLNQKEAGPAREKAFKNAQDAIILAQRAMYQLPPELLRAEDTKKRPAKEWEVITARLDEATQELEAAAKAVSETAGQKQQAALAAVKEALAKANAAIEAVPERKAGK